MTDHLGQSNGGQYDQNLISLYFILLFYLCY